MGNENSKSRAKKGSLDQHLRTAAKTGVVNLSNRKMEKIPKDLLSFSNLRTLDVSNNKLISLEPLKVLGNLTKINASGNNLVRVDLGPFHKLKTAELANNQISAIIRLPEKITTLDISSNELISIPDAVTTNSSLTSVDISKNKLTKLNSKLPDSLVELNLNDNQLNVLQKNYLTADSAPALKILRLNNNCLDLKQFSFLTDSNVSVMQYEGNLFTEKQFQDTEFYEHFAARYTEAQKKKD